MLMLCNPEIAGGETPKGNVVDYSSAKITLSAVSSYDAELHACSDSGEIGESTQATMAELVHYGSERWSISKWLVKGTRVPLLVIVDSKGPWTKIQNEWKWKREVQYTSDA